jgi:hypothetical protein
MKLMNNTMVSKPNTAIDKQNVHTKFGMRKMIAADTTLKINMLGKIGLVQTKDRPLTPRIFEHKPRVVTINANPPVKSDNFSVLESTMDRKSI